MGAVILLSCVAWSLCAASALAATSVANFDVGSGMLSITGVCSGTYVIVLIKNSANGSIWGSSNPPCVNGAYSYSIAVPDSIRNGGTFSVSAMDNGVPAAGGGGSVAPVVFAPQPDLDQTAPSITLDTSSVENAPDDTSFLDAVLSNCFGIITSAVNAVEASVVAAVQVFGKIFTVLPGGSIVVPSGQNQISGQGTLAVGESDVFIADTAVTSSSQIIVTPTSPTEMPLSVTQVIGGDGFDVSAVSSQANSVSFTWLIINMYVPEGVSSTQVQFTPQTQQTQSPAVTSTPLPLPDDTTVDTTSTDVTVATSTDATTTITDVSSTTPDVTTSTDITSITSVATTTDADTTTVQADATTTDIVATSTTTSAATSTVTNDASSTDANTDTASSTQ